MRHARTEYSIVLAGLGILLAIGIPSLQRRQYLIGGLCLLLAAVVCGWIVIVIWRDRG